MSNYNPVVLPEDALRRLKEGNQRFVNDTCLVSRSKEIRKMSNLAKHGQTPFAVVLSCSDSRSPTELIFDCGVGDIFAVRVAGNVLSPSVIASIEFAASNLGTPICLVMGHLDCGAVKAALKCHKDHVKPDSPYLNLLVRKYRQPIEEALLACGDSHRPEQLERMTTVLSIQRTIEQIVKKSRIIQSRIATGDFALQGSVYDISNGIVHFDVDRAIPRKERALSDGFMKKTVSVA